MRATGLDHGLPARVELYWLPLGAGDASHCVRWNGRLFEAVVARRDGRDACALYHSALEVRLGADRYVIEMAPVWSGGRVDRGAACTGPVGLPWLGRSRWFRYEVRCWRDGIIPDVAEAVDSPVLMSTDAAAAERLLELVPTVPAVTWGRDELRTGEMWNSNSVTSWLLAASGHPTTAVRPPRRGRAPGWSAGLVLAARRARSAGEVEKLLGELGVAQPAQRLLLQLPHPLAGQADLPADLVEGARPAVVQPEAQPHDARLPLGKGVDEPLQLSG